MCVNSTLKARRLLYKRSEAYIAYVVDKFSLEVTLDSMLVVREFSNVFSKDLPGLSLDRELEFEIELLWGSALIPTPPYRMEPVELKELKTQM